MEVLGALVDAPMKPICDAMASRPKLKADTLRGRLAISSDQECDEAAAVVCLLKMKMQSHLDTLVINGTYPVTEICCMCAP